MESEVLTRIKDAEEDARKGLAKAEGEAKAIVSEARRQADAILAEGREKADAQYQQRLESARAQATEETRKAVDGGKAEAEALGTRFAAGLEDATRRAVELFGERI